MSSDEVASLEPEPEAKDDAPIEVTPVDTVKPPTQVQSPSMTVSLFVTWIVPILIIAIVSRFGVNTVPPPVKVDGSRPLKIDVSKTSKETPKKQMMMGMPVTGMGMMRKPAAPSPSISHHPTSYQKVLKEIQGRKRVWKHNKEHPSSSPRGASERSRDSKKKAATQSSPSPRRHGSEDSQKVRLDQSIEAFRQAYQEEKSVMNAIKLADALRLKDLTYHDGGMGQQEALAAYQDAIQQTIGKRAKFQEEGQPTNRSLSGTQNVPEELMFDYTQKSVDGLLCALYTSMGKLYFMANMFEKAVESYDQCIEIEPMYLDAVGSRGSSLIILGKYKEAGEDFMTVIENDTHHLFNDAFTGMAKVLAAKEEVAPKGWGPVVQTLEQLISTYESATLALGNGNPDMKKYYAEALNRLHHVMFSYHDAKTKDVEQAWKHLTAGYRHKMSVIEPYNQHGEDQKLMSVKTVFHKFFWPVGVGSETQEPIFIIGFVRSGSTLLERVLDAHPGIVGTGEDSVFNGRLDQIRNNIVKSSLGGDMTSLKTVVLEMADSVTKDMRERWKTIDANTDKEGDDPSPEPERFADKMLTNYFNVGFIHMLFPKALILHVARNPMDVLWSAYKHEFPPGGLDYTSEFKSLASMYHLYREVINHWDSVLPGRVTHVRYEDLVHDMPGMARAIINATGLAWDDSVLEFHKKKQAVNTLSTTQVRKGIYKHSLEAWKKYETQLKPLAKLAGVEQTWDLKTTLPNYSPPPEAE